MSRVPALESPRLLLPPLELADSVQVQVLFPRWEIVRYLAAIVPWPYPPDGAYTYYRDIYFPAMERGEQWHWTLRLKTDPDQLIGAINLRRGENENRGFWIGLPWQERGLMTEATEVVTDYWFNTLQLPVLRTTKAVANLASRRISEKNGMRLIGIEDREYVSGRLPAEIWEITREEWNRRRSEQVRGSLPDKNPGAGC